MQDFKWKKDESDWLGIKKKKKDEINYSLPVYRVPIYLKGEQLILMTGFEGETCRSPCNQNKKCPNKYTRMAGPWNSHRDLWIGSWMLHLQTFDTTAWKHRQLTETFQWTVMLICSYTGSDSRRTVHMKTLYLKKWNLRNTYMFQLPYAIFKP